MPEDSNDDDYEIGYGRPPKSTQFKKGQSGNPRGRPPGAKGVAASLNRELATKIKVVEDDKELLITKAEALAKRLSAKALMGDMKALALLVKFDLEVNAERRSSEETSEAPSASPEDYEILRHHFANETGPPSSPHGTNEVSAALAEDSKASHLADDEQRAAEPSEPAESDEAREASDDGT